MKRIVMFATTLLLVSGTVNCIKEGLTRKDDKNRNVIIIGNCTLNSRLGNTSDCYFNYIFTNSWKEYSDNIKVKF